jgi:hypothetical protein
VAGVLVAFPHQAESEVGSRGAAEWASEAARSLWSKRAGNGGTSGVRQRRRYGPGSRGSPRSAGIERPWPHLVSHGRFSSVVGRGEGQIWPVLSFQMLWAASRSVVSQRLTEPAAGVESGRSRPNSVRKAQALVEPLGFNRNITGAWDLRAPKWRLKETRFNRGEWLRRSDRSAQGHWFWPGRLRHPPW